MIRVYIVETSAVVRSIEKQTVLLNKNLEYSGDSSSFQDAAFLAKTKKIDLILMDDSAVNLTNLENNLNSKDAVTIPVIIQSSRLNPLKKSYNNIFIHQKPDYLAWSHEQLEQHALHIEKKFQEFKSHSFYDRHIFVYQKPETEEVPVVPLKNGEKRNIKLIVVGVSTGGPGTVQKLLESIGSNFPLPILITQHIDTSFEKNLTGWLDKQVPLTVHIAKDGEIPVPGNVYFAPADYHMCVGKDKDNQIIIKLNQDPMVNFLRPSVDVLFESAAKVLQHDVLAVLLTGMGSDGARGCVDIKKYGGYTIGESEETCVIYGMPKAAFDMGGIIEQLPLYKIADRIKAIIGEK